MSLGRPIRISLLTLLAALAVFGSLPAAPAGAAGSIKFLGCITGKLPPVKRPRVPRPGGCTPTRTARLDGELTGQNHLFGLTASADGRSLYAISSRDDAVVGFGTKPFGLRQCLSTDVKTKPACQMLPHAGTEDVNSGFNGLKFITVSPDGNSVYTLSGDESLARFARSPGTGKLTFKDCITGLLGRFSSAKNHACKTIPTATAGFDAVGSGLGNPATLTVSPDNRFVYVAATGESAVTTFARAADGSLSFRGCLSGGSNVTTGVTSACTLVGPELNNPNLSGLRGVKRIVISADGTSLYASSPKSSSIAEFQRDVATGALSYRGCITAQVRGTGPGDPCRPIPTAQEVGFNSGMYLIDRLAIGRNGTSLYGLARGDDAVDSFRRDPATGILTYTGCLTGDSMLGESAANPCGIVADARPGGKGSGLSRIHDLVLSPSGRTLYVAATGDGAIARINLSPAGGMHFGGCLSARADLAKPAGPCTLASGRGGAHQLGFGGLSSLTIAGGNLYAAASEQSAISRFAIPGG